MNKSRALVLSGTVDASSSFPRPVQVHPLFDDEYKRLLDEYIEYRDEDRLSAACELGHVAMRRGMSVFEVVRLHENAWSGVISMDRLRYEAKQQSRAAQEFLMNALSPFEASLRRVVATQARVLELELALGQRGVALSSLAASNIHLEAALRCSKSRALKLCQQVRLLKTEVLAHPDKLIQVHEAERKRVSRELHDDIGQLLVALSVNLAILKKEAEQSSVLPKKLESAQAMVAQGMESVHRICRNLRADTLDRLGLHEAIATYMRNFAERAGVRGNLEQKIDLSGLGVEQEVVLYRIAQESITNVVKHAHATSITVRFIRLSHDISMEICDDGQAFNVEETLIEKSGMRLGLLGMRERVHLMRGDFIIESVVGRGTTVRVRLPLAKHADGVVQSRAARRIYTEMNPVLAGKTI